MPQQVEDLKVWQKAIQFTKEIYFQTETFPKEELYGLSSQMRRAAVSIAANIAEGKGRASSKELVHFLYIARASAYELDTLVVIAREVGLLSETVVTKDQVFMGEILSMLNGLIKAVK